VLDGGKCLATGDSVAVVYFNTTYHTYVVIHAPFLIRKVILHFDVSRINIVQQPHFGSYFK
jgi:hypothetical protein